MRGGGADAAAMGGVSGFGAAVSAGAGSSMDAERFGAGMNLADIGAGLATSNAGLAAGFASAGGSSSGITSDAGCAAAADAVRDGASAMGSPAGIAVDDPPALAKIGRARLNSSHLGISYAVFCLKKKKTKTTYP